MPEQRPQKNSDRAPNPKAKLQRFNGDTVLPDHLQSQLLSEGSDFADEHSERTSVPIRGSGLPKDVRQKVLDDLKDPAFIAAQVASLDRI